MNPDPTSSIARRSAARPLLLGLGALACFSSTAAADPFPLIQPGEPIEARLTEDLPALTQRGHFIAYRFEGKAGQRWVATMRSEDFDAYLTMGRVVGGIFDAMVEDDDGGGNTDARARLNLPEDGEYVIVAQALATGMTGDFSLELELAGAPTTDQVVEVNLGDTVDGELAETDAMTSDNVYFDTYLLRAEAGQRLNITVRSDDFDTYLSFGQARGADFAVIEEDDDGADGTNSRIRVTVPNAGAYLIRVRSFGPESTGSYRLSVSEQAAAEAPAEPRQVELDEEMKGELTENDFDEETGTISHFWIHRGVARERLTITQRSGEIDSFLAFGRFVDGEFQVLAENDDFEAGLDSRIEILLPADGEYHIRSSSLGGADTGAYTLHVKSEIEA